MKRRHNFYDERGLLYLDSVIRHGGIRRASAVLHVSASAISRQIKLLEDELNAPLLMNVGRRMSLTAVGHCVVNYINKIKVAESDLLSEIAEVQNFSTGHIRIASGGGFLHPLISGAIREFHRRYPGITYKIDVVSGESVAKMVASDDADIGFVFNADNVVDINCVMSFPCGEMKLISSRRTDLDIDAGSRKSLEGLPFVMLGPDFTIYAAAMRTLADLGLSHCAKVMECNSFEAVIEAVKADIGVTLLPNFCVSGGLKDGSLQSHDLPLAGNGPKFMSILGCKERSSDQLFRSFTDCIDNYFNKGHVL